MRFFLFFVLMFSAHVSAEPIASTTLSSKTNLFPIHKAIRQSQDIAIINKLISSGYDINIIDNRGRPIITIASRYSNGPYLLQHLIEMGANPYAVDKWGNTALHRLAQYNADPEAIQMFLNIGLNPLQENMFKKTPRSLAKKYNNFMSGLFY